MDGILTDTTTLGFRGPGCNGNEGVTPHSPELQNCSLTPRCSLVIYLGHPFLRESYPSTAYSKPRESFFNSLQYLSAKKFGTKTLFHKSVFTNGYTTGTQILQAEI